MNYSWEWNIFDSNSTINVTIRWTVYQRITRCNVYIYHIQRCSTYHETSLQDFVKILKNCFMCTDLWTKGNMINHLSDNYQYMAPCLLYSWSWSTIFYRCVIWRDFEEDSIINNFQIFLQISNIYWQETQNY